MSKQIDVLEDGLYDAIFHGIAKDCDFGFDTVGTIATRATEAALAFLSPTASADVVERLSFAWTATEGYKYYPPYVNLTGNRLAVRGHEQTGPQGSPIQGDYVAVELPDKALAELRAAIAAIPPAGRYKRRKGSK